jgi:hypothetical protein
MVHFLRASTRETEGIPIDTSHNCRFTAGLKKPKPMSQFLFCLSLIVVFSVNAQSTAITFQSATEQTALLELYTSEGCSSCPPAETWLSRLKESPGLWKDFVPLAFHVDYWDYLGWRDPWASSQFSDRQRAYAQNRHSDSIYTPEFVLSGREWRGWLGSKSVPVSEPKVGILTAASTNGTLWHVRFVPATPRDRYEVHVAFLSSALNSDVKAGENRGRRLNHDFVVMTLVNGLLTRHDDGFRGECVLPFEPKATQGRLALAVWVTGVGQLEPLQATGGWLPYRGVMSEGQACHAFMASFHIRCIRYLLRRQQNMWIDGTSETEGKFSS